MTSKSDRFLSKRTSNFIVGVQNQVKEVKDLVEFPGVLSQ